MRGDKSFAYDLIDWPGHVSSRVALLLRSAECKPVAGLICCTFPTNIYGFYMGFGGEGFLKGFFLGFELLRQYSELGSGGGKGRKLKLNFRKNPRNPGGEPGISDFKVPGAYTK